MKKIVVVGSLNVDHAISVPHLPLPGETVLADHYVMTPGGKGANQAYAIGRLGADVAMLGAIGMDAAGDMLLESLRGANVDVSGIMRSPNESTGMAIIPVSHAGDNSIIVIPGANALTNRDYVESMRGAIEQSDIVVMQLEIPMETVLYVARLAKSLGKTVVLDPAPAAPDIPDELLRCVDIATPNETELAILVNDPEAVAHLCKACAHLKGRGVKNVIATLGQGGAFLSTEDGFEQAYAPTPGIRVVDTTAAGDSFTAGVVTGLALGQTLCNCIESAMRVAEIVVTRKGAQASIPSREELSVLGWYRKRATVSSETEPSQ